MTKNDALWRPRHEAGAEGGSLGALAGIRVLDLCVAGPGPFGTLVLASFGAEVIHLARTGRADPATDSTHHNAGKRSIQVDLKTAEGRTIVQRLIADADVLVEGFRPGVMERLGLGPDDLFAVNERLLYVRLTGWGQDGPYALLPGHDINYLAISGALSVIGTSQPTPPLALLGDFSGGALIAVINILAALRECDRTGEGRVIDTTIVDGVAMLMHSLVSAVPRPGGTSMVNLLNGTAPFYRTYRCADDRWFSVGAIEAKFYQNLLTKLDLADHPLARRQYDAAAWPEISQLFAERFVTKPRDEWTELLMYADACAFPVMELGEMGCDPHLAKRGTVTHSGEGARVARAGRYVGEPATAFDQACALGANTEEVLRALDYSLADIERLRVANVIDGV